MTSSWKQTIGELDDLLRDVSRHSYEIAKRICDLHKDDAFLEEHGQQKAMRILQKYAACLRATVMELLKAIRFFPNPEQWEGRIPGDIISEAEHKASMNERMSRASKDAAKVRKQSVPKPTKSDPAANVAESATIRKQVEAELKRDFKQKARQEAERETKQALAQLEHRNKQAIAKIESEKTETIASLRDDLAELRRKIAQEKRKSAKLEGQVNILKQALLDSGIDPDALLAGNAPASPKKPAKRTTRSIAKQPATAKRTTRSATKPKATATRKKAGPKAKRKP